jgi:hypothetical protein
MKTTTTATTRSAAEIEEHELRPIFGWDLVRYLQARAVESAIAEATKNASATLESAWYPHNVESGIVESDLLARAKESPALNDLARMLAVKHVLDNCTDLPAIRAKLEPAFQAWEAAKDREAADARAAAIEVQRQRDAIAAAEAEAVAAVRAKFSQASPNREAPEPALA